MTPLHSTLKRALTIDGRDYVLTLNETALKLTLKGKAPSAEPPAAAKPTPAATAPSVAKPSAPVKSKRKTKPARKK
jgi:hypothetical protein